MGDAVLVDVHDVLAHLVDSAKMTKLGFLRRMAAAGFDFDKDDAAGVERERADDPARTLEEFRTVAARTSGPPAPLATRRSGAFVHGEDIRRPLGLRREYPSEQVDIALDSQVRTGKAMGGARELVKGPRLVGSGTEYQHGEGPEVRGTVIALLLAVSGFAVLVMDRHRRSGGDERLFGQRERHAGLLHPVHDVHPPRGVRDPAPVRHTRAMAAARSVGPEGGQLAAVVARSGVLP